MGALAPLAHAEESFLLDLSRYRNVSDETISLKRELLRQHDIDSSEYALLEVRLTARSDNGRGEAGISIEREDDTVVVTPSELFGRSWTTRSFEFNEEDSEGSNGNWRIESNGDFDFLEAEVILEEGVPARDCRKYGRLAKEIVRDSHRYYDWELDVAEDVCTSTALSAFTAIRERGFHEWGLRDSTDVNTRWALRAFRRAISGPVYFQWQTRWATETNTRWGWQAFDLLADGQYWEWELRWAADVTTEREWEAVERLYLRGNGRYTESELRRAATLDN